MAISSGSNGYPSSSGCSEEYTSCVQCRAFQPVEGRILHCLHVICVGCLKECAEAESGYIKCASCLEITLPIIRGVELSKQLVSSQSLLYPKQQSRGLFGKLMSVDAEFCETCEDIREETGQPSREATHRCSNAECRLRLCAQHAERHNKRRRFASHVMESLENAKQQDGSAGGPDSQDRIPCMFHVTCHVITYCMTCQHTVCQQCLAAGHSRHTFDTLSAVAEKISAGLEETLQASGIMGSNAVQRDGAPSVFRSLDGYAEAVSQEADAVDEEVKLASQVITGTFEAVEKMLLEGKRLLLDTVDRLAWQQKDQLTVRGRRLTALRDRRQAIQRITEHLTSGECSSNDVVCLCSVVSSCMRKLAVEVQAEEAPVPLEAIVVQSSSMSSVQELLQSLVMIETGVRELATPGRPLLVRYVSLDPKKCSRQLTLDDGRRVAVHNGQGCNYASVAAVDGFTMGRHQWKVKFHGRADHLVPMSAGVVALDAETNFNSGIWVFFSDRRRYGWSSNGAVIHTTGEGEKCGQFREGATISLTLDCDKGTLEMRQSGCEECSTITGLLLDEPLYPVMQLSHPGQRAQLCYP